MTILFRSYERHIDLDLIIARLLTPSSPITIIVTYENSVGLDETPSNLGLDETQSNIAKNRNNWVRLRFGSGHFTLYLNVTGV